MIKLSARFLHLLTQKIKSGGCFSMGVISVDTNVIADGVCGPKCVSAARDEKISCCNALKEFLCIVEQFARLFADLWVVENRWITTTQFPRMKKWRPIDVRNKVADRSRDCLGSTRRWRVDLGRWPRCFAP